MCPSASITKASDGIVTSPVACGSENRDRIYRRCGAALEDERQHREHELVARGARAGRAQRLQVGIIDEMYAHRDQHSHMNREDQLGAVTGRQYVAHAVASEYRDPTFVEPRQTARIEPGHALVRSEEHTSELQSRFDL